MTAVSGIEKVNGSTRAMYFQLDDSWRSARGKGVSVAVIDSGIDIGHPDLAGKVVDSVEARVDNKIGRAHV